MTVLDHMKAAGYDPNAARNADDLRRMGAGTMECESIQLRTFRCSPYQYEGEMLAVEATAMVPLRMVRSGPTRTDGRAASRQAQWLFSGLRRMSDMAKQMMKLTVEEVRANIPYDLICMVRYGCTWSSGRRRRAWLADFSESEREAAGRLFRMAHNWTVGRGVPDTVQMSRKTFHLWQKLGDFCASI